MTTPSRACKTCGREVAVTPSGHLRAHSCPHGHCCVPSYLARRKGARGKTCPTCRRGPQMTLF